MVTMKIVGKMTALMVSEEFNDSALIMAYSEIIGDFYDSLVEGDDDEGEAVLIALQEPYSIDEYFGIITTKYKWSNDDGWVTVISTMIHSFLSTHPFKNYACIADDIVIFADKSCDVIDKYDELMRINSYSDYKNHRIWSRYTSDECAQPSTIWQPIKMFNWDEYLESHGLRGLAPQEQADLFNCKFEAKDL